MQTRYFFLLQIFFDDTQCGCSNVDRTKTQFKYTIRWKKQTNNNNIKLIKKAKTKEKKN